MYYVVGLTVAGVDLFGHRGKFVKNRENASMYDGPAAAKNSCFKLMLNHPEVKELWFEPFTPKAHPQVPRVSYTTSDFDLAAKARRAVQA